MILPLVECKVPGCKCLNSPSYVHRSRTSAAAIALAIIRGSNPPIAIPASALIPVPSTAQRQINTSPLESDGELHSTGDLRHNGDVVASTTADVRAVRDRPTEVHCMDVDENPDSATYECGEDDLQAADAVVRDYGPLDNSGAILERTLGKSRTADVRPNEMQGNSLQAAPADSTERPRARDISSKSIVELLFGRADKAEQADCTVSRLSS